MKPVPRGLVMEWVLKSWEKMLTEMVANSIKSSPLVLIIDGSEDGLISCFNKGNKMQNRKSVIGKSNEAFQC